MIRINKKIFNFLLNNTPDATAKIFGGREFPDIEGFVEFYQLENGVFVVTDIEDLPKTQTNIFAYHIHEGNTCEDDFEKTGSHFNPLNLPHPSHAGDMPPLFSNDGDAFSVFFTDRFKIEQIIGKTVIIHDNPDDFTSQPSGNSGNKIACGQIIRYTPKYDKLN